MNLLLYTHALLWLFDECCRSIKNREYDPLMLEKPIYREFSARSRAWVLYEDNISDFD